VTQHERLPVIAAIDIGSNSIKMTVARPDGSSGIEEIDATAEVVRLGQGLAQTGQLAPDRVELALQILRQMLDRARAHGVDRVLAVATEATRAAANGPAFLARVRDEIGLPVRVIGGEEEAALTFRGVAATTDVSGVVAIADIGGGSTELIFARDGAVQRAVSIPLGSARLTDTLIASDPPSPGELAACEDAATATLARVALPAEFPTSDAAQLIVAGGTGEYLARLASDPDDIRLETIRRILKRLTTMTAAELARAIAIPEARARVLPAGIAVVAAIGNWLSPVGIQTAPSGIRMALLLDESAAIRKRDDEERGK
jgi:exopolyphosphatase/guanosine-5'-triphosphate,3'-diphosphate pyrophosphatase